MHLPTIFALALVCSCSPPTELSTSNDPVDTVLAAFDEYPLVAITELHGNVEVHRFLQKLMTDPRFRDRVDDIVVEFASAAHQALLDRYIAGAQVSIDELSQVWRDTVVSPQMTWDAPVYAQFFATVRAVNLAAEKDGPQNTLRVLAGDPPIDWSVIDNRDQLLSIYNDPRLERDVHFARIVEQQVLAKDRHALLISGGGHLTRRNLWVSPAPNPSPDTATVHLLRNHPGSVFVVNTLGGRVLDNVELVSRLAEMPHPSITVLQGHWIGDWPASDFAGVRRYNVEGPGKWPFEGLAFSAVADAALFLGTTFTDSLPPFGYQDEGYRLELNRRRRILGAPERTRVDQGIVEIEDLLDVQSLDVAARAIEEIKSWDPESAALDDRLRQLRQRIADLHNREDNR